jgi:hypothetical protein
MSPKRLRATPAGLLFRPRNQILRAKPLQPGSYSGPETMWAHKICFQARKATGLRNCLPSIAASSAFIRCHHCLPLPSISVVLRLRRHATVTGERATIIATPQMETGSRSWRATDLGRPPRRRLVRSPTRRNPVRIETSSTSPPHGTSGSERPPRPIPPLTPKPRLRPFIVECKVVVFVHH